MDQQTVKTKPRKIRHVILDDAALVRLDTVEAITGRKSSTLYVEIKNGTFPPGVKIGNAKVLWPISEVRRMNAARIAGMTDAELKALVQELLEARKTAAQ